MHQHRTNILSQHQSVFNGRDVFSENLLTVCMFSFSTCTKCFQLIQKKHTSTYIPTNVQKHPSTHKHTHSTKYIYTPPPIITCKYTPPPPHTKYMQVCTYTLTHTQYMYTICANIPHHLTHTHTHTHTHTQPAA